MNKDGQVEVGLSVILLTFVAVVVGVILFQVIAQEVGSSINTVTVNSSETLAVAGSSIYIEEYKAITGVTIVNASNQSQTVPSSNYTVTNNVVHNGALTVQVTTNDGDWNSSAVYVQGTGEPLTYISNSGGRAMASLIAIFFALAVALVALQPTLRQGILEKLGK